MTLQLHHPDGKGGLEQTPVGPDYRTQFRSPRWGKALHSKELPAFSNPEMQPTPVLLSIAFWGGLAFATFVIVALGYGLKFWH
ncbi:MAG TPA: hypothetical protein VF484_10615 [Candidatus Limnocylindrales bacterium]